jgi:LysR family transcriptional regulator, glycine cleavage system transcriptional activator
MARRYYNLPPLTMLASFEAAARNLSFKVAAQELNVTSGAVSHQIKALETEIGAPLFDRLHRGVALNAKGSELYVTLRTAFLETSRTLEHIKRASDDRSVTIFSNIAMASLWLTPRISRFWRDHPTIVVNQIVSDQAYPDYSSADLCIFYGKGDLPSFDQTELFEDDLLPVCAPSMAAALGKPSLEDLAAQRLIHLDPGENSWTGWQQWFTELGYSGPIAKGLNVNNYMVALQAAQDGAGVVLGWKKLVTPLLKSGALVSLGDQTMRAPDSFYILESRVSDDNPAVSLLKSWLIENR